MRFEEFSACVITLQGGHHGRVTVMPGTALLAAIKAPLADAANIGALSVDQRHTMPKSVTLCHVLLAVITLFIPDEWEHLLNNITPFNIFPDVPINMQSGFDMGIKSPPTHTYTPPNHNSAMFYPSTLRPIYRTNYPSVTTLALSPDLD